jgi:thioredoxin 1
MERLFTALMAAALVLMGAPGCGGTRPPVAPKADATAQAGAVCDTAPDTAAVAAAAVQPKAEPETPKPGIELANVAEKPADLPKMWDFGSTTCLPCKAMKQILDPMISDYKGKVDIRIIDVYKEKDQTAKYKIVTIPTQVFIDAAGKELYRHIGVYPRDSIETCFKRFSFPVVPSTAPPVQTPVTGST